MKNFLKMLFAGLILTGIVLGAIFLFNNSDLDNQVFNNLTSESFIASNNNSNYAINELCNIDPLNDSMSNTKVKFIYINTTMQALNLKMDKLIAENSNSFNVYKKDNDVVISAMKELKDSSEKFVSKKQQFTTQFSQYSTTAKTESYSVLYSYATKVVEQSLNLVKELENYNIKNVYNNSKKATYQDALLNIMNQLSKNVYSKILIKSNYSTVLINELTSTLTYYNSLNNNFAISPSTVKTSPAIRFEAYNYLVKYDIFNYFISSENKSTYILNLTGLSSTYAGYIYNILGGPAV